VISGVFIIAAFSLLRTAAQDLDGKAEQAYNEHSFWKVNLNKPLRIAPYVIPPPPPFLMRGTFRKQCHLFGTPDNRQSTEGRNTNWKTLNIYYGLPRTWRVLKTVANSLTSCATIGPSTQSLHPDYTAVPEHDKFITHNFCIRRVNPWLQPRKRTL